MGNVRILLIYGTRDRIKLPGNFKAVFRNDDSPIYRLLRASVLLDYQLVR